MKFVNPTLVVQSFGLARRTAWLAAGLAVLVLTSGCAIYQPLAPERLNGLEQPGELRVFAALPLSAGWYQGQRVHYVTTDISDRAAATKAGANHAPRLADALPSEPRRPGQRHALERIYAITNSAQDKILPSIPLPTGPASNALDYSPLWQIYEVTWRSSVRARVLRSEEEVLAAEAQGEVAIVQTPVIVNCPVVLSAAGGLAPGWRLLGEPRTP